MTEIVGHVNPDGSQEGDWVAEVTLPGGPSDGDTLFTSEGRFLAVGGKWLPMDEVVARLRAQHDAARRVREFVAAWMSFNNPNDEVYRVYRGGQEYILFVADLATLATADVDEEGE